MLCRTKKIVDELTFICLVPGTKVVYVYKLIAATWEKIQDINKTNRKIATWIYLLFIPSFVRHFVGIHDDIQPIFVVFGFPSI